MAATIPNIYQFKITLKTGHRPKIWRRIQVPETFNFWDLHTAIQDAMGWRDCHLHKFEVIDPKTGEMVQIGVPYKERFADTLPEKTTKIADYLSPAKNKASYEYDFGIQWEHDIILEKILPAFAGMQYPQCTAGKMACPPEDGGGVNDPEHEDYEEDLDGSRDNFNPVNFDPKSVKFNNSEERWQRALK